MERLKSVELGHKGEFEIAKLLHEYGITHIRRPDFLIFLKSQWIAIEVKNKEPFNPPPTYMQGMPKSQYQNDLNITHLGMPCILVVRGIKGEWLAEYIIKLKPQPDPRQRILCNDEIVWFNLSQFKHFAELFKEVV